MSFLQQFLTAVIPQSVLIAAVAWLVQRLVSQSLSRDVEKFRSELSIEAHRRNTIFAHLHERQADVTAELYKRLMDAEIKVHSFMSPWDFTGQPNRDERGVQAMYAVQALIGYFDAHRIWLSEETATKGENLVGKIRVTFNSFAISRAAGGQEEHYHEQLVTSWIDSSKELPALRVDLEKDFRRLLGVSE